VGKEKKMGARLTAHGQGRRWEVEKVGRWDKDRRWEGGRKVLRDGEIGPIDIAVRRVL
jgi:hypothetical protein